MQEYARSNSEQAFATLVSRRIHLVYSVALRQVHDRHLAEEITQAVFLILAHKAKSLSPRTILSGWLCRTARFVSTDTLKAKRRRQLREREAQMHSISNESDSAPWNQIAPLLDEALSSLGEKEHDAVVLRFLEGKEFKQVGAALGTSEDAARMRVNRGLEKLHQFFTRRGITVSAVALTGAVSANSVQGAPAGLAAAITTAALSATTIPTTVVLATTKTMAMTTLQKTTIAGTIALLAGVGIYEARQTAQLRDQVQRLQQQQGPLAEQLEQYKQQHDETEGQPAALRDQNEQLSRDRNELLRLRGEVGRLRDSAHAAEDPFVQTVLAWKAKETKLQKLFEERPEQRIPEMQFLTDRQWLDIARDADLDSDSGILTALSSVRSTAKAAFVPMIQKALDKYSDANNGNLPADLSLLRSYFDPSVDEVLLQRYEALDKQAQGWSNGAVVIEKAVVDPSREGRTQIGPHFSSVGSPPAQPKAYNFPPVLIPTLKAYQQASKNPFPKDFGELENYVTTPEQKAALEKLIYLQSQ